MTAAMPLPKAHLSRKLDEPLKWFLDRRVGRALETIKAICSSRRVEKYKVGITKTLTKRHGQYRGVKFKHFVGLMFDLTQDEARAVEKELHYRCDKHCGKKYQNRGKDWRNSVGHAPPSTKALYSIYMAWW